MKQTIPLLSLITLMLITSCEKTVQAPVSSIDPESKAKLFFETSVAHPVLFAVVYVPEGKKEATGWIISKEGDRRNFSLATDQLDFQSSTVPLDYLVRIMGASKPAEQLSFAELLPYYQTNKQSAYSNTKSLPDRNESGTTYILGFTGYDGVVESPITCGSGHPTSTTGPALNYFYQVALEASGVHNLVNENPGASRTCEWLKSFGLPEDAAETSQ